MYVNRCVPEATSGSSDRLAWNVHTENCYFSCFVSLHRVPDGPIAPAPAVQPYDGHPPLTLGRQQTAPPDTAQVSSRRRVIEPHGVLPQGRCRCPFHRTWGSRGKMLSPLPWPCETSGRIPGKQTWVLPPFGGERMGAPLAVVVGNQGSSNSIGSGAGCCFAPDTGSLPHLMRARRDSTCLQWP